MAGKRATISIDLIADASKAKAGLKQAEDAAGSLQNQFKNVAKTASAAFATREIVNFGKGAIDAASDLAESMNAVQVTFGDASDEILRLGENASKTVGMSARDFNAFAVQFAGFTKQIAGANGDVTAVTDELTTRIADFASVMNLDIPRAAQIFQSSLAGSSEPARAFGIDMSDAAVKAHALATGLVDSTAEMTEAEKVTARYDLLLEETNQMAGDFANTSDGLANSMRILEADLDNAKATIGEAMVPALEAVTSAVVPVLDAFSALPKGLQQTVVIGGGLIAVTKSLSTTVQGFGVSAKNANKFVGGLTTGVGLALIAFNQYQSAKQEIAAAADRVRDALDAETLAITENTDATIKQDFLSGELGKAMEMLGLDVDLATAAVMGNEEAAYAFIDSINKADDELAGFSETIGSWFDGTMRMNDAVDVVRRNYQGMHNGFQDARAEAERLAAAEEELTRQSTYVADATDEMRVITDLAKTASQEFERKTQKLGESLSDVYAETNQLIPEIETLLGLFDQEEAIDRAEQAVEDFYEALADATVGSRELEAAQRNAEEQIYRAIEAMGRIPREVQTDFKILVDQGQLDQALAKLERIQSARAQIAEIVAGTAPGSTYIPEARDELAAIGAAAANKTYNQPELGLATGGIVMSPTVARLGEYGPEAVIPLTGGNARGGFGSTYNIVVNAGVGDPGSIGQKVVETIKAYERRNGNSWRQ